MIGDPARSGHVTFQVDPVQLRRSGQTETAAARSPPASEPANR
jgi:hypothetical protein